MTSVPKKVSERLSRQISRFQKVLHNARNRDVNESDTVMIITDMLADVFGFDKYMEVTSEQAIRGTYCDLAVKLNDSVRYLIEVKAIGLTLKENHLRQAVNYGANHGIPWVVLTNGVSWEIYRIKFDRPLSHELVLAFDFLELNRRKSEDQRKLFLLCREGVTKAAIEEFHRHVQNVNRFVVSALIQSDPVLMVIRRELRRLAPGAKVSIEELKEMLPDILKRDVLEGESAEQARKRVQRALKKAQKAKQAKTKKESVQQEANEASVATPSPP